MKTIVDGLAYPVIVSTTAATETAAAITPRAKAVVVICDRNVAAPAAAIALALREAGVHVRHVVHIAAGERKKSQRTASALYAELVSAGTDRQTVLIAVGGGTLTDVAGFVAATYMRGIAWLAVSTTLLGMVDAAIGGKTGIDLPEGKNLVGAIWEPIAVVADVTALDTLPLGQRRAGLAEVVKAAIIGDPALLETVRRQKLRARGESWAGMIAAAARVKVDVVAQDVREQGVRAVLNLGHTSAHAIEYVSRYRIAHGQALAMGLRVAGILARERTGWALTDHTRMLRALRAVGLSVNIPALPVAELLAAMRHDKKRFNGELQFVLPVRPGEVRPGVTIQELEIGSALQAAQQPAESDGW